MSIFDQQIPPRENTEVAHNIKGWG